MSTNYKNIIRPEYFKNFTNAIIHREILVESGHALKGDIQDIVYSVNSKVNQIIQKLNCRIDSRQIPYITLDTQYHPTVHEQSRMVLVEQNTHEDFEAHIKEYMHTLGHNVSHLIEILAANSYQEIVISPLGCNSAIVISKEYIDCALVDILLDIAMFNSYSFLESMPIEKKYTFSQEKCAFFLQHKHPCFYEYRDAQKLYYSFAFTARVGRNDFDIETYIKLWDNFIAEKYGEEVHIEKTIPQQLKQHVDYKELPKHLAANFKDKPRGCYLILRTNKDVTEVLHPSICSVFGLGRYRKGKIKIIPIDEFDQYEFLCPNLDISVFKIVKPR